MTSAFVFVQVAAGANNEKLHTDLHAIKGVKTVHYVAGPVDLILFLDAADNAGLFGTIRAIRSTSGVAGTDTRIVLG